ncbi:WYL domain-containing protein [Agromyces atrinae]|uniref:helix-turn-helix transcriptional regulator n=1 Tax=Agromyces atrinae TaxID=592376 RepID=UPI001F576371|nr:WYL domain-containing protein [Agromyces atrinae]MCI2958642.1 WYL domain-containing protein [Agromyces atrinae]
MPANRASSSEPPVPVEERLFSLVLALLATETGLTKSQILSTVHGYSQRHEHGGQNASLERQFERDKDDIRELGIPIETIDSPDSPGDNRTARYRIPKGLYDLPSDITFSPEELSLLGLAATVWREGSLSTESRRALTKLRSFGIESQEWVIGYAPKLRVRDAAFEPLSVAVDRRQLARFGYLKPGEAAPRMRTVEPYAVVLHDGRWHLFGHDRDADDSRTFLLSRIVGDVELDAEGSFDDPGAGQAEKAIAGLDDVWRARTATLDVVRGSDADIRLTKRPGAERAGERLVVHYTDANVFADELTGFGPEVRVVEPASLADAVRARLLAVAEAHRTGEI